jgi:ribonuclease R
VGVHIADVSHYVKKDSALDNGAKLRGNSVYLVGEVVPMLPENLSNGICSLVPNKDRLTFTVIFELTKRGKVVNFEFVKSIINSKRRFTYEEVQEIIESGNGDFADEIILLNNLAKALRKKRVKEGSIEFHTPEVVFELDSDGKPINVIRKELKESNMLVEEFMLLANRTVARNFLWPNQSNGKSFIYRIHDKPDKDKIKEFSRFVKTLGYSFNADAFSDSREIQRLINQVKDSEEDGVINELAIRSMAKAIYSIKNIGHFGLGFKYYTHFTSPIRRYSDLVVHRLVHSYSQNKARTDYSLDQLREISDHVSACERNAIEAERHSVKIKQVEFLKDKVGEVFNAVISGVTYYGIFVEITDILAEGLIRVRDLEGDFYVYDDKKYSLIGRYNKKRYRLGDKLLVKLVRADLDKYVLDFITVD